MARVEQLAQEKEMTCYDCGSSKLKATEARSQMGPGGEASLVCQQCGGEVIFDLSDEEAQRLGLYWTWEDGETTGSRAP